jgi:hypothetical protein
MIIKAILVLVILIVMAWFLSNRTSHQVRASQKIGFLILVSLGIIAVISPNASNYVAHKLGVGRGADLLLYLLTLAFLFMTLNLYLKDKEEQKKIVTLTRRIAILETVLSENNKKSANQNKR